MPDKKHARLAKAFASMHHSPHKAEIDRKADRILRTPHGSGEFSPADIVQGYGSMDDYMGAQYAQQQEQQLAQKKKKKNQGG